MNAAEYLASADPEEMLILLLDSGRATERKSALFATACCRFFCPTDRQIRPTVAMLERFAAGLVTAEELAPHLGYAWTAFGYVEGLMTQMREFTADQQLKKAALFGCIFGDPRRTLSLIPSALVHWNDGCVVKMANTIYNTRAFDRLPLLADALEDAGCTDAAILSHCRTPGEHVRGCWVVDLLLGKS